MPLLRVAASSSYRLVQSFSSLSIETIRVPVSATDDTGALVTLTGDQVEMAFKLPGVSPTAPDWLTAAWDSDTSVTPNLQLASILIGPSPGLITLTPAVWQPWVRIHDSPEIKVGIASECIRVY
jgi:hypothetical protein